jgi:hypothetical protein
MFSGCIPHQVAPLPLKQPALSLWVLTTEPEQATQLAETSQPTWAGSQSEQAGRRFGYSAEDPERRDSGDPRAEKSNQRLLAVEAVPE